MDDLLSTALVTGPDMSDVQVEIIKVLRSQPAEGEFEEKSRRLKRLLPLLTNIDLSGPFGSKALIAACYTGDAECATVLIIAGCDPIAASDVVMPDDSGEMGATPLIAAAARGNIGCIRACLQAGADPTVKTKALGSKWKNVGTECPTKGVEVFNELLKEALRTKSTFSSFEVASFGLQELEVDSFIRVDSAPPPPPPIVVAVAAAAAAAVVAVVAPQPPSSTTAAAASSRPCSPQPPVPSTAATDLAAHGAGASAVKGFQDAADPRWSKSAIAAAAETAPAAITEAAPVPQQQPPLPLPLPLPLPPPQAKQSQAQRVAAGGRQRALTIDERKAIQTMSENERKAFWAMSDEERKVFLALSDEERKAFLARSDEDSQQKQRAPPEYFVQAASAGRTALDGALISGVPEAIRIMREVSHTNAAMMARRTSAYTKAHLGVERVNRQAIAVHVIDYTDAFVDTRFIIETEDNYRGERKCYYATRSLKDFQRLHEEMVHDYAGLPKGALQNTAPQCANKRSDQAKRERMRKLEEYLRLVLAHVESSVGGGHRIFRKDPKRPQPWERSPAELPYELVMFLGLEDTGFPESCRPAVQQLRRAASGQGAAAGALPAGGIVTAGSRPGSRNALPPNGNKNVACPMQ